MNTAGAIKQMVDMAPLMRFSPYTQIQVQTVLDLGAELLELLDKSIDGNNIDGQRFTRAYSLFWLWVLASFEITRTLCQAKSCFSERLANEICLFKKRINHIRVPFAKLQRAGERRPIVDEASVNLLDTDAKDLNFRIGEQNFSARDLIANFERITKSIQSTDVRKSIYGQVYFQEEKSL